MQYLDAETVAENIQSVGVPVNSSAVDHRLTLEIRGTRTTVRIEDPLFRCWVHAAADDFPTGPKVDEYRAELQRLLQTLIGALSDDEIARYDTNGRLVTALICDCIQEALHNRS